MKRRRPDTTRRMDGDDLLIDLLSDKRFRLPLDGTDDLPTQMQSTFKDYVDGIIALPDKEATLGLKSKVDDIRFLADGLVRTVQAQLHGTWHRAFSSFRAALSRALPLINKSVVRWAPGVEPLDRTRVADFNCPALYRIRIADPSADIRRSDLFHIPFQLRDRTGLQRFSLPGLPCLYLGRSLFACWEELGRPPMAGIWASQFRAIVELRTLVIPQFPQDAQHRQAADDRRRNSTERLRHDVPLSIAEMMILWPLFAACLIRRRRGRLNGFVQEYIVPQMLLEAIVSRRRGEMDGWPETDAVVYPSTRAVGKTNNAMAQNWVFPVQTTRSEGFCPVLHDAFELSGPVNWEFATSLALPGHGTWRNFHIRLPRTSANYLDSSWGKVEVVSDLQDFKKCTDPSR